jgi:hypothetical protein
MGHASGSRPLLGSGIEYDRVGAAGNMARVGLRTARGKQPPISQKAIAAAKEIEDPAVVALDRDRMEIVLVASG